MLSTAPHPTPALLPSGRILHSNIYYRKLSGSGRASLGTQIIAGLLAYFTLLTLIGVKENHLIQKNLRAYAAGNDRLHVARIVWTPAPAREVHGHWGIDRIIISTNASAAWWLWERP